MQETQTSNPEWLQRSGQGTAKIIPPMRAPRPERSVTVSTLRPFANDCFHDRRLALDDPLQSLLTDASVTHYS
jgi:hypothetical protein